MTDESEYGWRICDGVPRHFEPLKMHEAQRLEEVTRFVHTVQTINFNYRPGADPDKLQLVTYYLQNLNDAIILAQQVLLLSVQQGTEFSETVVQIRPVGYSEQLRALAAIDYSQKTGQDVFLDSDVCTQTEAKEG